MYQISDYELELMKIIWANGGTAMYADIFESLKSKDTPWTKNTIITLLSRLVDKGMIKTSKTGRRNIYAAAVAEHEYQAEQAGAFVRKKYDGNTKGLVVSLIDKDLLSAEDYEELKKYWEEKKL
jgi:predicted transcriptional regulator